MKKVALNDLHQDLGAKMVEFAGYNMPVRYSSDKEEHLTVRNSVGVFDVSHMGEFFLYGPDALDLIQRVSSNDASKLVDGKAQYGCLPNGNGGIVDDFLTYRFSEEKYMLVVNASNIQKDWDWINQHNSQNVKIEDASDEISLFAVQGPKATEALQSLTSIALDEIKFYNFEVGEMAGIPDVIISATGYTGAGGFELYAPNDKAEELWRAIFEAGEPYGIRPIGLAARDTLRLEMGYCLYGNDIDDSTSPLEAGLGWVTKFTKDFVDSEFLQQQKAEGIKRKLTGIQMLEKGIPRKGYEVFSLDEEPIGTVTSGTLNPSTGIGIGLGYLLKDFSKPDSEVLVGIRNRKLKAKVVKPPFTA